MEQGQRLRMVVLGLAALGCASGVTACAGFRNKADAAVFARSTTVAIASVQGQRDVAIHRTARGNGRRTDGLDHLLQNLDNQRASDNGLGVAVTDNALALLTRGLQQHLALTVVPQPSVAAADVPSPEGPGWGMVRATLYTAAGTHFIAQSSQTGERLGAVARQVHADLAVRAEVACTVDASGASATVRLAVGDVLGAMVGNASGESQVQMNELLRGLDVTADNTDVVRSLCGGALAQAMDGALLNLKQAAGK